MLTLFDLGADFWRNYHGTKKSALDAYSLTYDRIEYYREQGDPGRFVICCDSPRSVRKEKHPTYKASREPKDPAAIDSLRSLQDRMRERGVPVVLVDGYEGDDGVATLTRQAWPEEVVIVGSEKDFYCLIDDDRVSLVGKSGPISEAQCLEKFGVKPCQMTDFLAMVGDAADDIKGCENCGPGRCSALLGRYDSWQGIRAALESGDLKPGAIPGVGAKTIESLKAWDPTQALELVTMNSNLPIKLWEILK